MKKKNEKDDVDVDDDNNDEYRTVGTWKKREERKEGVAEGRA